jgi:hypothetical protein
VKIRLKHENQLAKVDSLVSSFNRSNLITVNETDVKI